MAKFPNTISILGLKIEQKRPSNLIYLQHYSHAGRKLQPDPPRTHLSFSSTTISRWGLKWVKSTLRGSRRHLRDVPNAFLNFKKYRISHPYLTYKKPWKPKEKNQWRVLGGAARRANCTIQVQRQTKPFGCTGRDNGRSHPSSVNRSTVVAYYNLKAFPISVLYTYPAIYTPLVLHDSFIIKEIDHAPIFWDFSALHNFCMQNLEFRFTRFGTEPISRVNREIDVNQTDYLEKQAFVFWNHLNFKQQLSSTSTIFSHP